MIIGLELNITPEQEQEITKRLRQKYDWPGAPFDRLVPVAFLEAALPDEITLQPLAMVAPNSGFVYAPSRIQKPKTVSKDEFLCKHGKYPHPIQVSREADGVSKPVEVMAYGYGLDCWYTIAGELLVSSP